MRDSPFDSGGLDVVEDIDLDLAQGDDSVVDPDQTDPSDRPGDPLDVSLDLSDDSIGDIPGDSMNGTDATQQVDAQDELPFPPAGPEAAPDPMQPGPFPVGVVTLDLYDENRREWLFGPPRFLRTEIWYPAVPSARDGPFWAYDFHAEVDEQIDLGNRYDAFMQADIPVLPSMAVRDAEIDREHGPYPVIFFSHGAYSLRFEYLFYTVHLASHGYLVVAPDHDGNTTWDAIRDGFDFLTMLAAAPDRLEDMSFLLDEMHDFNRLSDHFFFDIMDLSEVAVTGHSYGGFVATAMPYRDSGFRLSVQLSPVYDMLQLYRYDLGEFPVPVMVMGGTADQTVAWQDQYCGYRSIDGVPKYLYELDRGGHFTFSDMCRLDLDEAAIEGAPDMESDGCSSTENVPYEVAHQSIIHYATAFFNRYARDSTGSAMYLQEYSDAPFDVVVFHEGDLPDWPEGGCSGFSF